MNRKARRQGKKKQHHNYYTKKYPSHRAKAYGYETMILNKGAKA
jgi:hypothetical protein